MVMYLSATTFSRLMWSTLCLIWLTITVPVYAEQAPPVVQPDRSEQQIEQLAEWLGQMQENAVVLMPIVERVFALTLEEKIEVNDLPRELNTFLQQLAEMVKAIGGSPTGPLASESVAQVSQAVTQAQQHTSVLQKYLADDDSQPVQSEKLPSGLDEKERSRLVQQLKWQKISQTAQSLFQDLHSIDYNLARLSLLLDQQLYAQSRERLLDAAARPLPPLEQHTEEQKGAGQ